MAKEKIVIVGTGWAGYTVSQKLDDKKFEIVVISSEDTSPYTPLLVCAPRASLELHIRTPSESGKTR